MKRIVFNKWICQLIQFGRHARAYLIVGIFAFFSVGAFAQSGDQLGAIAAGMSAGTWRNVPQNSSINTVLGQDLGHSGNILGFSNSAAYDSTRGILYFAGLDHSPGTPLRFVSYTRSTNTWADLGIIDATVGGHGYQHTVVDPLTGTVYHKVYGDLNGTSGRLTIWSRPFGGSWSKVANPLEYEKIAGMAWWDGPIVGGGRDNCAVPFSYPCNETSSGTLFIQNGELDNGQQFLYNTQSNAIYSTITGTTTGWTGADGTVAAYSHHYNVAVFGGGNFNLKSVYRMNPDHSITQLTNAPINVGIQQGNIAEEPVTGGFLIKGSTALYYLDPTGAGTYTLLTAPPAGSPPTGVGDQTGETLPPGYWAGVVSVSVPELKGVLYVGCFASTCGAWFYKYSDGETLSERCGHSEVIRCFDFEIDADLSQGSGGTNGATGFNHGVVPISGTSDYSNIIRDTAVAASGVSSMRMRIPATSFADASGSWFTNFSSDYSVTFGENSEFYVQWRQRFSPEYLTNVWLGGGGWKLMGVSDGDPGLGMTNGYCDTADIVVQNTLGTNRGFAQAYQSCSGSTSHVGFWPFESNITVPTSDLTFQNARPFPRCLYSQELTIPQTLLPPNGNCFGFFANEWMTFQIHVKLGPRGSAGVPGQSPNDEFVNSYFEMWIGREGGSSELVYSYGPYNHSADAGETMGKVIFLTYDTGRCAHHVDSMTCPLTDGDYSYPVAYTWYDSLVISRNRIVDPVGMCAGPPFTISSQEGPACVPYPGGLFTTQLPNAGSGGPTNHLLGNTGSSAASDAMVALLTGEVGQNQMFKLTIGTSVTASPSGSNTNSNSANNANPLFYGQASDPLWSFTNCTTNCSGDFNNSFQVHIPEGAHCSYLTGTGSGDGFMDVWDQATNEMVRFYCFNSGPGSTYYNNRYFKSTNCCTKDMTAGGGVLQATAVLRGTLPDWGSHNFYSIKNAPLSTDLRISEMVAGQINHALIVNTKCENDSGVLFVFPALSGGVAGCGGNGVSNTNRPIMGQLFFLDYTDAQIAAMSIPTVQKAILTAGAHYGFYFTDTCGASNTCMDIDEREGDEAYNVAMITNPYFALTGLSCTAGSTTDAPINTCTVSPFASLPAGWDTHIHVADPCVAKDMAGVAGGCTSGDTLTFSQQPTPLAAGSTFSPTVTVTANLPGGGVDTGISGTATITIANGCGTSFTGTFTQAFSMGVATFSGLGATPPAVDCIATATASGASPVNSSMFDVTCTPDHLLFTSHPGNANVGAPLGTVSVSVKNTFGVTCTNDISTITIANEAATCTGMSLGGTTSAANVLNVSNLTESAAGFCTLHATDGALTAADSNPFTISGVVAGHAGRVRLRK